MTSNTLWTQQMLNILISWLRDHTHIPAAPLPRLTACARGGQKQPPTPSPHCRFLLLLKSSPFVFFRLSPSAAGPRARGRQVILASELSYTSLSKQKQRGAADGQTPDLSERVFPYGVPDPGLLARGSRLTEPAVLAECCNLTLPLTTAVSTITARRNNSKSHALKPLKTNGKWHTELFLCFKISFNLFSSLFPLRKRNRQQDIFGSIFCFKLPTVRLFRRRV